MTTTEFEHYMAQRRDEQNTALRARFAAARNSHGYVPCEIGHGKIHAARQILRDRDGHLHPRPLCQPVSSRFYAGTVHQDTPVTCKRCLASLGQD